MEAKYFIILFGVVNVVYDDNEFPYKHILLPKKVVQEDKKPNINKIPYPFKENNENQFFARRIIEYKELLHYILEISSSQIKISRYFIFSE